MRNVTSSRDLSPGPERKPLLSIAVVGRAQGENEGGGISLPGPFRGSGVASSSGGGVRGRYCVQRGRGWISTELRRNYARSPSAIFAVPQVETADQSNAQKRHTKTSAHVADQRLPGGWDGRRRTLTSPPRRRLPMCTWGPFFPSQNPRFSLRFFRFSLCRGTRGLGCRRRQLLHPPVTIPRESAGLGVGSGLVRCSFSINPGATGIWDARRWVKCGDPMA